MGAPDVASDRTDNITISISFVMAQRPFDADLKRYCYESEPIGRRVSTQSRAYWPPASILCIATFFASEH